MRYRTGVLTMACGILLTVGIHLAAAAEVARTGGADSSFALGARLGTLGVGGEAAVRAADWLTLRLMGHGVDLSYQDTIRDVDFEVNFGGANGGVVLDLHAPGGAFHLSAGLFYNGNTWDVTATPRRPTRIGDLMFEPAQIGTLRGEADVDPLAVYVGIGFGNPLTGPGRFTVSLDLGVWWFLSEPDVRLTADGTLASHPLFQRQLAIERDEIQDRMIQVWPVLSLGLAFRF